MSSRAPLPDRLSQRALGGAILLFALIGCGDSAPAKPGTDPGATGGAGSIGGGGAGSTGGASGAATGGAGGSSAGSNGTGGSPSSSGGVGGAATAGSTSGGAGAFGGGAGGVGGAPTEATIVPDPSWTCSLAEGIVVPSRGELAFQLTMELGDRHDVGATQYGERRIFDVSGGELSGDSIDATLLEGGIQFELTLSNGAAELEGVQMLRASDGSVIYLRSCGVRPAPDAPARLVFDFEVANGSALSWLNTGTFVGEAQFDASAESFQLDVYDVAGVAASEPKLVLTDPESDLDQPWECATATGTRGASVFTEQVSLGASLSVGASKRGTRNVIPITGGTVSGRVTGSVVPGGADYQLVGNATILDARYTLAADDGEFIVVRNCGPFGALVPLFEARAAGPYAFLNENHFVSSDPGVGSGGVSITFYELD